MLVAVLLLSGPGRAATPAQFDEHQVKAAFLLNFLKFVAWPDAGHSSAGQAAAATRTSAGSAPLVIAVLGDDELARALQQTAVGQSVGGRPVVVRAVRTVRELDEPLHLLFIGPSERANLSAVLRSLEGRPVLTVGDSPGFGASGVVLNLYVSDKRIRFEANTTAATRAGLRISSHLLRIARIVG